MRTEAINIYKFDELSNESKHKAIKQHRDFEQTTGFYAEMLSNDYKEQLSSTIEDPSVEFSLSYCQGDGVAFYGKLTDEAKIKYLSGFMTNKRAEIISNYLDVEIVKNSLGCHYSHYNTMNVNHEFNGQNHNLIDNLLLKVAEKIESNIRQLSKDFEAYGYNYLEDCSSDENISECIRVNEYEFYADGSIFFNK